MTESVSRRACLLTAAGLAAASAAQPSRAAQNSAGPARGKFTLGFNTSTIRARQLPLSEVVDITIEAGYHGIEPWVDELEKYSASGGSLEDLGKKLADAGVGVESAIAFFEWIVDDADKRKAALESAKKAMELVKRLGGKRIAAPPAGATRAKISDLGRIAERYAALLKIGDSIGIVPELEIWGPSQTMSKLSEAAYVMVEARHPAACLLPDVYHLHRGRSEFTGLRPLAQAFHVMHFNDYHALTPIDHLVDADRVFPGDGGAPLKAIVADLAAGGANVMLSLELFNESYYRRDPRSVARTGLEKMRAIVGSLAT